MNELIPIEKALQRAQAMNVFTPTGLLLPDTLTSLDYYCIVIQLSMLNQTVGWGRADLALRIKEDFPDDYEQRWGQLANMLGKVYGTIVNDAATAARYTVAEREHWMEAGLTYSHCRIAGSQEKRRCIAALTDAVEGGWSVSQLQRALFGTNQIELPVKSPTLSRDEIVTRYKTWIETFDSPVEREHAEFYVSRFIEYIAE